MKVTNVPPTITTSDIERRNIALYPRSWAIVDRVNAQFDLNNVSAALRVIISEYERLSEQEAARLQATK